MINTAHPAAFIHKLKTKKLGTYKNNKQTKKRACLV